MKKILLPALLAISLFASDATLELTNNTLMINGSVSIPQNQNFALRGGYLYNDNTNKDDFYYVGVEAVGYNAIDNYNSKLSVFIEMDHTKNNTAVPIGIRVSNSHFGDFQYPLFASASIAYAPAILSFDDADRFTKTNIQIGLQPIDNAKVFVGYRNISFDSNYQSAFYFGVGFIF